MEFASLNRIGPTLFFTGLLLIHIANAADQKIHAHIHGPNQPHFHPVEQSWGAKEQKYFLDLLFKKYGNEDLMSFEAFEHLLQSLGLANIEINDHDIKDHVKSGKFREFHSSHKHFSAEPLVGAENIDKYAPTSHETTPSASKPISPTTFIKNHQLVTPLPTQSSNSNTTPKVPTTDRSRSRIRKRQHRRQRHKGKKRKYKKESVLNRARRETGENGYCLTPNQLLAAYHLKFTNGLNTTTFLNLCPAIVYQIDTHVCSQQKPKNDCPHQRDNTIAYHPRVDKDPNDTRSIMVEQVKPFDLFAIPAAVWGWASLAVTIISLVGLLGVAVIPIMQKGCYHHLLQYLVALAIGSLTGDAMLHLLPHALGGPEPEHDEAAGSSSGSSHSVINVYKGLLGLGGVYFFFIMERLMNICSNRKARRKKKRQNGVKSNSIGRKLSEYGSDLQSVENVLMVVNPSGGRIASDENTDTGTPEDEAGIKMEEIDETQPFSSESPTHNGGHSHGHNHGHSHGHSHEVPTSIASVAWMVIMGDGLHNFCDGLAIGAAFANSLTGGVSTTVAVFCHELPHEMGDFAVLIKSGMTAKQAIFYNVVSSVLSFLGMLIGICLGNIEDASLFIFAGVAGMFMYIALADMLPEISQTEGLSTATLLCGFLLQTLGIGTGVTIMFLIAMYEDKIVINIGGS